MSLETHRAIVALAKKIDRKEFDFRLNGHLSRFLEQKRNCEYAQGDRFFYQAILEDMCQRMRELGHDDAYICELFSSLAEGRNKKNLEIDECFLVFRSCTCGKLVKVYIDGNKIEFKEDCIKDEPKFVMIEIKDETVLAANSLRFFFEDEILQLNDMKLGGKIEDTENFAKQNVLNAYIPNICPSIKISEDKTTLLLGENDGEYGVITDQVNVTIVDKKTFLESGKINGMTKAELEGIIDNQCTQFEMKKGRYKCTYNLKGDNLIRMDRIDTQNT